MLSDKLIISILAVTATILILIVAMIIVILSARRKTLMHKLSEALHQNKLNEVSMRALCSQMNPHFIFNCLNSIKLYTEQSNTEAASEYIDKFSKLIRNMLDSSRNETTVLSAEIETLRLYLEMEQMRFKNKLQYEIITDEKIDVDFIEIPPLLIQPYVENSIWHGIMHKETTGTVTVRIQQDGIDNALVILVEDDGIGRAKAARLKNKKNITYKSHGTQITADRIALLNAKQNVCIVSIADLYDNNNTPRGTLVTLKLSIKCQD